MMKLRPALALVFLLSLLAAARLVSVGQVSHAEHPGSDEFAVLSPSPDLSPSDVVRIQLEALRKNDNPYEGAGADTAFRFASPENQAVTGPRERFQAMLASSVYRVLINHQIALIEEELVGRDKAMCKVQVLGEDSTQKMFVFVLRREASAECQGCWRTDSVIPIELSADEVLSAA